ncbi:MAG TPA: ComEC/Rec2 family competence protein [Candidatus Saccharimonadia bacterium]|nr:ComEC/Rec2 family competence protein [Candidatus Saccharimonadia bacterium]
MFAYHSGLYTLILPGEIQAKTGDMVQIAGISSNVRGSLTDGAQVQITLTNPSIVIKKLRNDSGILLLAKFHDFLTISRGNAVNFLNFALPQENAGLAAGMLLGTQPNIDKKQLSDLQTTGLLHVIAASGANLEMVRGALEEMLKKLHPLPKTTLITISLWIYCALASFTPSILRATLMASIQLLCALFGKEYVGVWALFISCAVMLVFAPYLVWSISFQLSAAASFAMAEVYPKLRKRFQAAQLPVFFSFLKGTFLSSLAVTIIGLPLLIYHFGSYSIISFISNLAVLWIVPYIMIFTVIALVASMLLPEIVSSIAILPIWGLTDLWLKLIGFFAKIPFALIQIPQSFALVSLIPCIFAVVRLYKRDKYVL